MNSNDPASELRKNLLSLTYSCPKGSFAPHCPFSLLAGLSDTSRRAVFERMDYNELVLLFDLVPQCACPVDPRNQPVRPPT